MTWKNVVALFFVLLAIHTQAVEDSRQKSTGFKKVPVGREEGFPNVEDFFKNFVIPRIPVVIRDETFVLVPDFDESDLATSPLSITTYVQARMKGDTNARYHMSVRQFVKGYRQKQLYLDDAIPTNIKSYVPLPKCLLCKAVFDELLSTRCCDDQAKNINNISSRLQRLMFHHGKHEGSMLATKRNFLGCQITGISKIHFFSPVKFPEHDSQEVPDEEKSAEMDKNRTGNKIYLNMDKENQTYFAKLKAGDCVYIPTHWLHQWTTSGNSVNVGINWSNKKIEPTSTVCGNHSEQNLITLNFKSDPKPDLESLFVFEDLHHFIKNYFLKNEEESMTFKTFEKDLQKDKKYMEDLVEWNSECSRIAEEMFQQMDTNDDGFLSLTDFDHLSYENLKDLAGKIEDRLADFKDIFEDQGAEQKGSLFDSVKNSASNYEQEFRNMIDEEFDEIFRDIEAVREGQKDTKGTHAVKDHKTMKEEVSDNEGMENVENKDSTSEKRRDGKDMDANENIERNTDSDLKKDEL